MRLKIDFDLRVGGIVRNFVLLDLVLIAGWGVMEPFFSIFILENVPGATLSVIGIAAALYWLVKSIVQLPIANYLDHHQGETDDLYVLVAGLVLGGISAFLFLVVHSVWQLYLVQILHGLAFAGYTPAWAGIFSRHLDKDRYSFDWALDSTAVGVSAGIAGFVGGLLADRVGFEILFVIAGVLSLLSTFFVLTVPKLLLPPQTSREKPIISDHKVPDIKK